MWGKYDAWKTKGPHDDDPLHLPGCPADPDADQVFGVPELSACTCPTPEDLALARAEAKRDE